jgi:hypothetical protein
VLSLVIHLARGTSIDVAGRFPTPTARLQNTGRLASRSRPDHRQDDALIASGIPGHASTTAAKLESNGASSTPVAPLFSPSVGQPAIFLRSRRVFKSEQPIGVRQRHALPFGHAQNTPRGEAPCSKFLAAGSLGDGACAFNSRRLLSHGLAAPSMYMKLLERPTLARVGPIARVVSTALGESQKNRAAWKSPHLSVARPVLFLPLLDVYFAFLLANLAKVSSDFWSCFFRSLAR